MARSRTFKKLLIVAMAKVGKVIFSIPPFSLLYTKMREMLYDATGSHDYVQSGVLKETFLKAIKENLIEDAKKITTPSLIVWGENDTVTPLSEAHILKNALANSQLKVFPDAGHSVHKDHPQDVATAITKFIDS